MRWELYLPGLTGNGSYSTVVGYIFTTFSFGMKGSFPWLKHTMCDIKYYVHEQWNILLFNVALFESIVNALWFRLKHHLKTFLGRSAALQIRVFSTKIGEDLH